MTVARLLGVAFVAPSVASAFVVPRRSTKRRPVPAAQPLYAGSNYDDLSFPEYDKYSDKKEFSLPKMDVTLPKMDGVKIPKVDVPKMDFLPKVSFESAASKQKRKILEEEIAKVEAEREGIEKTIVSSESELQEKQTKIEELKSKQRRFESELDAEVVIFEEKQKIFEKELEVEEKRFTGEQVRLEEERLREQIRLDNRRKQLDQELETERKRLEDERMAEYDLLAEQRMRLVEAEKEQRKHLDDDRVLQLNQLAERRMQLVDEAKAVENEIVKKKADLMQKQAKLLEEIKATEDNIAKKKQELKQKQVLLAKKQEELHEEAMRNGDINEMLNDPDIQKNIAVAASVSAAFFGLAAVRKGMSERTEVVEEREISRQQRVNGQRVNGQRVNGQRVNGQRNRRPAPSQVSRVNTLFEDDNYGENAWQGVRDMGDVDFDTGRQEQSTWYNSARGGRRNGYQTPQESERRYQTGRMDTRAQQEAPRYETLMKPRQRQTRPRASREYDDASRGRTAAASSNYMDFYEGERVRTPNGIGTVQDLRPMQRMVIVKLDQGSETSFVEVGSVERLVNGAYGANDVNSAAPL